MKCVKLVTAMGGYNRDDVVRVSDAMGDRMTTRGTGHYVCKAIWKETGRAYMKEGADER